MVFTLRPFGHTLAFCSSRDHLLQSLAIRHLSVPLGTGVVKTFRWTAQAMSDRQLITGGDAIADLVPASVVYDNHVAPLRILANTLILASAVPLSTETQQRLNFILNCSVRGVIRTAEWIAIRLHELYDDQPECGGADLGVTWYWPNWSWYDGDQLVVKCTGWEGMSHWTGCQEFPADHADYDMW